MKLPSCPDVSTLSVTWWMRLLLYCVVKAHHDADDENRNGERQCRKRHGEHEGALVDADAEQRLADRPVDVCQ